VTVGTIHDLIPLLHAEGSSLQKDRFLKLVEDHRRFARLVIVPSQATKRDLIEHLQFPQERIRVVYHGIDVGKFHPGVHPSSALMARHGLSSGQYLLYVGAIEGRKNIERMVEGYLDCVGSDASIPLVLAGTFVTDIPALRAVLADGTGRVKHIGYVGDEELPGLYRGARALVHVAVAEGFGFTPLEAMACGTPVVTAKQAATGEVVGAAGLLVDAYSVHEIAAAIRALLVDDGQWRSLGSRGIERARQLTWEHCAEKTYAVYAEALQLAGAGSGTPR